MLLFNEKVFDAFVVGTQPVYTDAMWDAFLGTADHLIISCYIDQIAGMNPSWQCRSQHSNDRINWHPTQFLAEFFGALTPGQPASSISYFNVNISLGAYARYMISLEGADHQAHIKLWVCGRGQEIVDVPVPLNPRP